MTRGSRLPQALASVASSTARPPFPRSGHLPPVVTAELGASQIREGYAQSVFGPHLPIVLGRDFRCLPLPRAASFPLRLSPLARWRSLSFPQRVPACRQRQRQRSWPAPVGPPPQHRPPPAPLRPASHETLLPDLRVQRARRRLRARRPRVPRGAGGLRRHLPAQPAGARGARPCPRGPPRIPQRLSRSHATGEPDASPASLPPLTFPRGGGGRALSRSTSRCTRTTSARSRQASRTRRAAPPQTGVVVVVVGGQSTAAQELPQLRAASRGKPSRAHPAGRPAQEAAAIPFVALTAWEALRRVARAEKGQRLLVLGGGGAVGGAAVQLARAWGMEARPLTCTCPAPPRCPPRPPRRPLAPADRPLSWRHVAPPAGGGDGGRAERRQGPGDGRGGRHLHRAQRSPCPRRPRVSGAAFPSSFCVAPADAAPPPRRRRRSPLSPKRPRASTGPPSTSSSTQARSGPAAAEARRAAPLFGFAGFFLADGGTLRSPSSPPAVGGEPLQNAAARLLRKGQGRLVTIHGGLVRNMDRRAPPDTLPP